MGIAPDAVQVSAVHVSRLVNGNAASKLVLPPRVLLVVGGGGGGCAYHVCSIKDGVHQGLDCLWLDNVTSLIFLPADSPGCNIAEAGKVLAAVNVVAELVQCLAVV